MTTSTTTTAARPILYGLRVAAAFDFDAPAFELFEEACIASGFSVTRDDWRREIAIMRKAGSVDVYARFNRSAEGARFDADGLARRRLWAIATYVRETPAKPRRDLLAFQKACPGIGR